MPTPLDCECADVDESDLDLSKLEEYIDASATVLVFATEAYFESRNCIRELRRSVERGKPIITLLEPDTKRGGLKQSEMAARIQRSKYVTEEEREKFMRMLCADQPIEWSIHAVA